MDNIFESYLNGEITGAQCFSLISQQINVLLDQKELVRNDAIEEAKMFNKGEAYHGFVWEVRTGKTTYDFEKDEEYAGINDQLKARRRLLTDASKKAHSGSFIVTEEGEQIEPVPIKSVAKDSLIFKEPKNK